MSRSANPEIGGAGVGLMERVIEGDETTMTPEQLRIALRELNGERDAVFAFAEMPSHECHLHVPSAILIPDEPDHLVKVTDGKNLYIIEPDRVVWIKVSLKPKLS